MAFEFPDPNVTSEFEAANGIVYSWDATDGKWVVKAYKSSTGEYVTTEVFTADQQRQDDDITVLGKLVKGRSYTYVVDNNLGGPVSRPGDISCNSGFWSSLSKFSFGTADADGITTPTMYNGDIIEIYNADENKTNRYKVTDSSGAPTIVLVQYISGDYFVMPDATLNIQVYPDSNIAALEARVATGENIQAQVQENILTLQQEVDALENTRYVGTWNAIDDSSKNGRPPGDGNFYFNQGGIVAEWSFVGWIYIADIDSNGVTFTHTDIQVGDQIEIISKTENSYGIYTIESVSDAGNYIAIKIETMNRSDGIPATGAHLIKIFSIDTGVDLNEADARYMKLRGNQQVDKDVAFRIRQDALDDTGNTFVSISDGEMNLYHVAYPAADEHAANQKYVNDQVGTRLPLTGGNMTGGITTTETTFDNNQLVTKEYVDTTVQEISGIETDNLATLNTEQTFTRSADKTILSEFTFNRDQGETAVRFFLNNEQAAQLYYDSAITTRLQVEEGKEFKIVTVPEGGSAQQVLKTYTDGGIRVEKLKAPQQDHHAATKAYVDSVLARPARLAWKWDSTSSGDSAPPTGAFKYTTNGSDHYYRLSLETYQGVKLGESIISEFNRTIDNGPVGTIWYKESSGWKFKQQFRINTFRWNYNNHFEFRVTSRNGSTSFTAGTPYYITIGGFF